MISNSLPAHPLVAAEHAYRVLLGPQVYPEAPSIEEARLQTNRAVNTRNLDVFEGTHYTHQPMVGPIVEVSAGASPIQVSLIDRRITFGPHADATAAAASRPLYSRVADGIAARESGYAQARAATLAARAVASRAGANDAFSGLLQHATDTSGKPYLTRTRAGEALYHQFTDAQDAFTARSISKNASHLGVSEMAYRNRENAVLFPQLGKRLTDSNFSRLSSSALLADRKMLEYLNKLIGALESKSPHTATSAFAEADTAFASAVHARYSESRHATSIHRDPTGREGHTVGSAFMIDPASSLSRLDGPMALAITDLDGRLFDLHRAGVRLDRFLPDARNLQYRIEQAPQSEAHRQQFIEADISKLEQALFSGAKTGLHLFANKHREIFGRTQQFQRFEALIAHAEEAKNTNPHQLTDMWVRLALIVNPKRNDAGNLQMSGASYLRMFEEFCDKSTRLDCISN